MTAPPTTTVAPPPTAADGTDLRACRDGTCEVLVTEPATVQVPRNTGLRSLKVIREGSQFGLETVTTSGSSGTSIGGVRIDTPQGWFAELTAVDGGAILKIGPA